MTNNYNAFDYVKDSEGAKRNDENLKEMTSTGRCNSCRYFRFGGYKCTKHNDNIKITYTEKTDKGDFINVIKPTGCNDYKKKGKSKAEREIKE